MEVFDTCFLFLLLGIRLPASLNPYRLLRAAVEEPLMLTGDMVELQKKELAYTEMRANINSSMNTPNDHRSYLGHDLRLVLITALIVALSMTGIHYLERRTSFIAKHIVLPPEPTLLPSPTSTQK